MRALLLLGLIGMWAFSIAAWPDLPERIPVHFNGSGQPDGWQEKGFVAWFLLPTIATVMALFLGFLLPKLTVGMARRNSPFLNMPNQKKFRALAEDARVRVADVVSGWVAWMAFVMTMLFFWIQYAANEVAHERWRTLPTASTIILILIVGGSAILLAVASSRAVTRETEEQEAQLQ